MRKAILSTLLLVVLILGFIPLMPPHPEKVTMVENDAARDLDFWSLAETFGNEIPVVVRFSDILTDSLAEELELRAFDSVLVTPFQAKWATTML